ncbi:MAG: ADP-ribosylglycohydrolase family protein [Candidatus Methanoperedens sp.]|nr:ADP-ribosylglycohydrolase family protein [Candidatus Methanoperedens sp.]MCZ7403340.1 ADP-ribosylglycohydrolase family protein [Candidatus Methanoperedens sp.]
MKPLEKLRSKYIGCMLGAAIGDALGKQNEGLGRKDILENGYVTDYGKTRPGCPGEKLRKGQYTDDTEQMIVLAQSLIECNGFDAGDFAGKIAKWGAEAQNDPAKKKLVGPSSSAAISRLNSGITWKESGSDIPSCGSAMRVAPIGLFYKDMDEIESNAALSSVPTHNSRGAIAGAVAVAVAVRSALWEKNCIEIVKDAANRASKYDSGLAKKIELSFEKKDIESDKVFEEFGTSYLVYDTVPCAFYCFSRHFEAPEKAITEAVNAGGDTDSIACMTGALCGALHGIDVFPEKWLNGLENRKMIEHLSNAIWRKSENI